MEHNYVTVALCILFLALHTRHGQALTLKSELVKSVEITAMDTAADEMQTQTNQAQVTRPCNYSEQYTLSTRNPR